MRASSYLGGWMSMSHVITKDNQVGSTLGSTLGYPLSEAETAYGFVGIWPFFIIAVLLAIKAKL